MKHFVSSIQENMHGLLEHIFVINANLLRSKYPNKTIRNATVFASGVPEFARFGYIELIDARKGIPEEIPDRLITTIKRSKRQPIWMPGPKFPDEPFDLFNQMKPYMLGDQVLWLHMPSQKPITWRKA